MISARRLFPILLGITKYGKNLKKKNKAKLIFVTTDQLYVQTLLKKRPLVKRLVSQQGGVFTNFFSNAITTYQALDF